MTDFLDVKTCILLSVIFMAVIISILLWKRNLAIYQKQEKELQMYRTYVKPLEGLIREIRAKQHEFDNHLNAILNMHITIDTYDELVAEQSNYIRQITEERDDSYLSLLKISDKVLAGFLYSKLAAVRGKILVDLTVGSREILTNVPERDLIEIVGTLFDNAVEACNTNRHQLFLFLTSENERLIFEIKNEYEKLPVSQLAQFFERGFSTKQEDGKRGLGLWNAKKLVEQYHGELYAENEEIDGRNYISFRVEL